MGPVAAIRKRSWADAAQDRGLRQMHGTSAAMTLFRMAEHQLRQGHIIRNVTRLAPIVDIEVGAPAKVGCWFTI